MKTVHEVSELAGVSVRTLHHYDRIGLLVPSARSDAGYRFYSDDDLARLQQIMLLKELEFSLADIRSILNSPSYDARRALDQQIRLLELKRDHLSTLIDMAKNARKEVGTMSFEAFDTSKIEEYAKEAKASWGSTPAWKEYEQKSAGRTKEQEAGLGEGLMELFVPFGRMAAEGADPASDEALAQAGRIQTYISEHYYRCTNEIFAQLGASYGAGGDFTRNINAAAGEGAAEFAAQAVAAYCARRA